MSTPYVSGIAALFLEKHGLSEAHSFFTRLMNTARPLNDLEKPFRKLTVTRQGAGAANAYDALFTEISVTPAKIELKHIDPRNRDNEKTIPITIHNDGKYARTFKLKHVPALSVPIKTVALPQQVDLHASVKFEVEEILVPAFKKVVVSVTIDPSTMKSNTDDNFLFSGFVEVAEKNAPLVNAQPILSIPYLGMFGTLESFSVFHPILRPKLIHSVDNTSYYSQDDVIQTLLNPDDYVILEFDFNLPSSFVSIFLLDADDPSIELMALDTVDNTYRNANIGDKYTFAYEFNQWDQGVDPYSKGHYRLSIEAFKGNTKETWLSPIIQIRNMIATN
jgi:hypothetical protein